MINHAALAGFVREWGIAEQVIEKDYCLGWALKGIAAHPELKEKWVFKGGTCLKKCYLETYRFSEDLDFTVLSPDAMEPSRLPRIIGELTGSLRGASGIDYNPAEPKITYGKNALFAEVKIYFRGPRNAPNPAAIKFDLSGSEKMADEPVLRKVYHPYREEEYGETMVKCYSLDELFAEKIRAMSERCMPRDLYDIINLFRRNDFKKNPAKIRELLIKKCASKGVSVPSAGSIMNSPGRIELENSWEHMLGHQLPALPPIREFWDELPGLFGWLEGKYEIPERGRITGTGPDEVEEGAVKYGETPPRFDYPVEAIRFAAVNRLLVNLGYHNTKRLIEPYSLRRTKAGHLILHAEKLGVGHRRYRINKIQSVEITNRAFTPKYAVEFPVSGIISAPPEARRRR